MSVFNSRVSSFAAILLLVGSSVMGQTNTIAVSEKSEKLLASDAATYVREDTYELPWATIPMKNVLWKKRVWRTIDGNDIQNKAFGIDATGKDNSMLVDILLNGVFNGAIKAYDATTDRLGKVLAKEEIEALITAGKGGSNPQRITKYEVKEDWLFLKDENEIVVRIAGLAPIISVKGADGKLTDQPMFWIYYPDSRAYLAGNKVASANEMNWDQVFEGRGFNSVIVKVANTTYSAQLPTSAKQAETEKH